MMIHTWQSGDLIYDLCETHSTELWHLLQGATSRNANFSITFDVYPETCCVCDDKTMTTKGIWRAIITSLGGPNVMRLCKR